GNVGDVYFAIVTLAITLILYTIVTSMAGPEYHVGAAKIGGFNGIPGIPGIAIRLPGIDRSVLFGASHLVRFMIVLATIIYVCLRFSSTGKFGNTLAGIRDN